MLHLKSYFAVFKECLSPAAGGPTVITWPRLPLLKSGWCYFFVRHSVWSQSNGLSADTNLRTDRQKHAFHTRFCLFCKEHSGSCINIHAYSLGRCATDGAVDWVVCKFILDSALSMSRGSSVGLVTIRIVQQRILCFILCSRQMFSVLRSIQTSSILHLATYPARTGSRAARV